jgi:hypothetical protein
MSVAILFLFANLIGLGLGPLIAGMLSDLWAARAGQESLRYALLSLCPGYFWAGWHMWKAGATVMHDLSEARPEPDFVEESAENPASAKLPR